MEVMQKCFNKTLAIAVSLCYNFIYRFLILISTVSSIEHRKFNGSLIF